MDSQPLKVYKVRDINEAGAILCLGFDLHSTEEDPNGRIYFTFVNSPKLQGVVKDYWACTLQVPARYYSDALKTLKNIIYRDR